MNRIYILLMSLCLMIGCSKSKENTQSPLESLGRVLMVCSSDSTFNGNVNGTFLPELAIPIYEFHNAGIEVDIISPAGGRVPVYFKFDTTEVLAAAIASDYYLSKINDSKTVDEIDLNSYAAIIVPGGYAQFNDVHGNPEIAKSIVDHYQNGGLLGSIGHGTALIASLKNDEGAYITKGVTMTSFPDWNELNIMTEANKGELLPFLTGEKLKENGANLLVYDHEQKINYEVIDIEHRIVTASFADGGAFVAEKIIELMDTNE